MAEENNIPEENNAQDADRARYEQDQLGGLFKDAKPSKSEEQKTEKQPEGIQGVSAGAPLQGEAPKEQRQESLQATPAGVPQAQKASAEKAVLPKVREGAQAMKEKKADIEGGKIKEKLAQKGATGEQIQNFQDESRLVEKGANKNKMKKHEKGEKKMRAREDTKRVKRHHRTTLTDITKKEAKKSLTQTVLNEVVLPGQAGVFAPMMYGAKAAKWGWKGLKKIIGG